jgi:hypothetical protein
MTPIRITGIGVVRPHLGLSELQHDIGRHLIGCVFLASERRHPQHIEYGVAEFMQAGID